MYVSYVKEGRVPLGRCYNINELPFLPLVYFFKILILWVRKKVQKKILKISSKVRVQIWIKLGHCQPIWTSHIWTCWALTFVVLTQFRTSAANFGKKAVTSKHFTLESQSKASSWHLNVIWRVLGSKYQINLQISKVFCSFSQKHRWMIVGLCESKTIWLWYFEGGEGWLQYERNGANQKGPDRKGRWMRGKCFIGIF